MARCALLGTPVLVLVRRAAPRHNIQHFCVRELGTRSGRSKSSYSKALKRAPGL